MLGGADSGIAGSEPLFFRRADHLESRHDDFLVLDDVFEQPEDTLKTKEMDARNYSDPSR